MAAAFDAFNKHATRAREFAQRGMTAIKTGAVDLTGKAVKAATQAVKTIADKTADARKKIMKLSIKGAFIAAAIGCTGVSVYGAHSVSPYSRTQNIPVLNQCLKDRSEGRPCSPEGAAEKARSNAAMVDLGLFAGGLFGAMGFGIAAVGGMSAKPPAQRSRQKPTA